ncbi:hypothetical protein HDZ31DRAFT_64734 [Schizophyllum fasciatum]
MNRVLHAAGCCTSTDPEGRPLISISAWAAKRTMSARAPDSETSPLLQAPTAPPPRRPARKLVWAALTALFAGALVLLAAADAGGDALRVWLGMMPRDADLAARVVLRNAPVIVSAPSGVIMAERGGG